MKKLYRSKTNKVFAGIFGGMEELLNVDANLLRLAFVFCVLITGIVPLVIVYIVAAFIIPEKDCVVS